jgi:import inner membrane translocase subunit TIM50
MDHDLQEAHPLIDKLDPYGHILYRLYREATRYENGVYVKDLSHLNRDLSKVVAVDIKAEALKEQPENLLMLKAWDGSGNDSTLLDIIPFLESGFLQFQFQEMISADSFRL